MRFEEKVSEIVRDRVFAVWKINPQSSHNIEDYVYTYTLTGCVGIVKKWLNDGDMRYTPKEFAKILQALTADTYHIVNGLK